MNKFEKNNFALLTVQTKPKTCGKISAAFKDHLFYPEPIQKKKKEETENTETENTEKKNKETENKELLPHAISSAKWREYRRLKEEALIQANLDKEKRKEERLKKKKENEEKALLKKKIREEKKIEKQNSKLVGKTKRNNVEKENKNVNDLDQSTSEVSNLVGKPNLEGKPNLVDEPLSKKIKRELIDEYELSVQSELINQFDLKKKLSKTRTRKVKAPSKMNIGSFKKMSI